MKSRFLCFVLAVAMAVTVVGCKEAERPSAPTPAQTPAPTLGPEFLDWREAYAGLLEQVSDQVVDVYALYDVDKDGQPELFVQYGDGEAAYHTICYTLREGETAVLGDFSSGHTGLYSIPGEKGFLQHQAHMGNAALYRWTLTEEGLVAEGTILEEKIGPEEEYTDPGELVSGSEWIPVYNVRRVRDKAEGGALTLPVYDYEDFPRQAQDPLEYVQVRENILRLLGENGEFYGVSGDGFYGDTGWTTLSKYLQPGVAYPYGEKPLTVGAVAWPDVNGDGQTDCVLRLERAEGEGGQSFYIVLGIQDGTVYAYFFGFLDGVGVDPDGTVFFKEWENWRQVSFDRDQGYDFPALREPVEGAEPAWDVYPENH